METGERIGGIDGGGDEVPLDEKYCRDKFLRPFRDSLDIFQGCSRGRTIGVDMGWLLVGPRGQGKCPGIGNWWKNYTPVFPLILHKIL